MMDAINDDNDIAGNVAAADPRNDNMALFVAIDDIDDDVDDDVDDDDDDNDQDDDNDDDDDADDDDGDNVDDDDEEEDDDDAGGGNEAKETTTMINDLIAVLPIKPTVIIMLDWMRIEIPKRKLKRHYGPIRKI